MPDRRYRLGDRKGEPTGGRSYFENVERGLQLAVNMLSVHELPDSRAVSDEFVALASLSTGDDSAEVMKVIDKSLDDTAHKLHTELKKAFKQ